MRTPTTITEMEAMKLVVLLPDPETNYFNARNQKQKSQWIIEEYLLDLKSMLPEVWSVQRQNSQYNCSQKQQNTKSRNCQHSCIAYCIRTILSQTFLKNLEHFGKIVQTTRKETHHIALCIQSLLQRMRFVLDLDILDLELLELELKLWVLVVLLLLLQENDREQHDIIISEQQRCFVLFCFVIFTTHKMISKIFCWNQTMLHEKKRNNADL